MSVLDNYFGISAQSVVARSKRAEILASNIINADTPNYKAKDLDFASILNASNNVGSVKSVSINASHGNHISSGLTDSFSFQTKYRVPENSSLDGNTVDSHVEKGQFAENAVRYQISLSMLNNKIQGLISTLKGE
ncbi:MAG: flagellar basal body rod protein FlgB [Gammaproteobacteria bacterium]|nr:MAG: flagellar basal body rod protein FlgB [Gammaproteobacteria bacterium]